MSTSEEAYEEIFKRIVPETVEAFFKKTQDYRGGPAFLLLGSKGQFSDINRKFWKLYAAIWEEQELTGEQPHEIVQDFIGHCFLMLYCLEQESKDEDEQAAGSRGNFGNWEGVRGAGTSIGDVANHFGGKRDDRA